jgi:hypothetical protein
MQFAGEMTTMSGDLFSELAFRTAHIIEVTGSEAHEDVSVALLFSVFSIELFWSIEIYVLKCV